MNISLHPELARFINANTGKGWKKSDILNAGVALVYMIETQGELPDISLNELPYRPWDGDSVYDYKSHVKRKRRHKHLSERSKKDISLNDAKGVKKPKKKKKNILHSQIEIEADSFDWDE